jgi:hypothetical protein
MVRTSFQTNPHPERLCELEQVKLNCAGSRMALKRVRGVTIRERWSIIPIPRTQKHLCICVYLRVSYLPNGVGTGTYTFPGSDGILIALEIVLKSIG